MSAHNPAHDACPNCGCSLDRYLVILYERYSEECWAAVWMNNPSTMLEDFTVWLRQYLSECAGRELEDYESAGLPALRQAWEEATRA